jgi:hypothetical protein
MGTHGEGIKHGDVFVVRWVELAFVDGIQRMRLAWIDVGVTGTATGRA